MIYVVLDALVEGTWTLLFLKMFCLLCVLQKAHLFSDTLFKFEFYLINFAYILNTHDYIAYILTDI